MVSDNVDEVVSSVAVLEDLLHMIDIDIAIFEAGIKTQSAQHQKTMDVMVSGMAKLVEDVNALARHSIQLDLIRKTSGVDHSAGSIVSAF